MPRTTSSGSAGPGGSRRHPLRGRALQLARPGRPQIATWLLGSVGIPLLVCLFVLWLHARRIYAFFERGVESDGTIERIKEERIPRWSEHETHSRFEVTFTYRYEGAPYVRKRKLLAIPKGLRARESTSVLVDPRRPGRAIVRDLYRRRVPPRPRS